MKMLSWKEIILEYLNNILLSEIQFQSKNLNMTFFPLQ